MTKQIWYWGSWHLPDHTPENWTRLQREGATPDRMADLYLGKKPGGLACEAIIGDPDAPLPAYKLTINTNTTIFSLHELHPEMGSVRNATFHVASEHAGVEGGRYESVDAEREGQLFLFHLRGIITDGVDQPISLSVKLDLDGQVRSETRVRLSREPPMVVEVAPWPGLESETDWLWADYPEFNEYDDLIGRAHKAFDFFFSGPDPRLSNDPREA